MQELLQHESDNPTEALRIEFDNRLAGLRAALDAATSEDESQRILQQIQDLKDHFFEQRRRVQKLLP